MKKKTLLLGVAALGILATATSCTETEAPYETPDLEGKTINVYVNYCAQYGASFTGKVPSYSQYLNPIDGKTYVAGNLLPMWETVAKNLNCTIKDAVYDVDGYVSEKDTAQYTSLSGYAGFNTLDFVMMNNTNANTFSADGKLVDISKYLDVMPNYKKFLENNPTIRSEMTNTDGAMYMLPYFDGLNTAEHMFVMNTELVEAILDDSTVNYDTTAANATSYSPTIKTDADYKVGISVNGQLRDFDVKASQNPVARQNALTTKNGKTYAEALIAHIDAAYGHEIGAGKTYTKRSEIFTSEAACYNTDDLIALMRAVVNNSKLLGYEGKVEGFIPREGKDSRIDSVLWLMQIFGIQGIRGTSEKDALYYNSKGELLDGRTQEASYDGLTKLNQLYSEGLIVENFDAKTGSSYTNTYLTGNGGAALLMFDYNATQTVKNKTDENGIGTANSKFDGVMPILPPLAKWEEDTITPDKYAYSRYIESSRANKGAGTVIPKHATEEGDKVACMFADYFFSEEGTLLQDYGPEEYRDGTITLAGETFPKFNAKVVNAVATATGIDWNKYCRMAIGSTHGIGHVRTDGVEYQFTNAAGRDGGAKLNSAIASGAVITAASNRKPGFGAAVPSQWSSNAEATEIQTLVDFWARGTGTDGWRKVILQGWDTTTRNTLKGLFETSNTKYLQHYKNLLAAKDAI